MFADNLKYLRETRGISQVELAKIMGVKKQTVSNWENKNYLPSIDTLKKLSQVFDVSTDWLLGLDNRKYLEISGLTDEQLSHVQLIIDDLIKSNINGNTD